MVVRRSFTGKVDMLLGYTDDENSRKRIADGRAFILRDWTATKLRTFETFGSGWQQYGRARKSHTFKQNEQQTYGMEQERCR